MSDVRPPRLRAGVHAVPRDDRQLQVGLDPPRRVLVNRDPDLLATLEALAAGQPAPDDPTSRRLLTALRVAGLLEEESLPPAGTVVVRDRLDTGLAGLLEAGGVRLVASTDPDGYAPPPLVVLVSAAPPPRAEIDPLVADEVPHLVVAGTGRAGSLRIGPLVEPGLTACQRCVDAHEAGADPRRRLVVEQLAHLPAAPLDPLVVRLAAAWAAREAISFVSGRRPLTWSATIDVDGPVPLVTTWDRHPHCGCSWDQLGR